MKLQKIMFFYTYVLESLLNKQIYIGSTRNLVRRVKEHNLGLNISTKAYKPWRLIYYEACRNNIDAKRREAYFKSSQGGRLLKRRVKEYLFTRRFAWSSTTRMNFFRKHEKFWKIIVIIASLALVATSLLPLLAGGL